MKASVEAGNLRHGGKPLQDRFDCSHIIWLMEGGKRNERPQLLQNLGSDHCGTSESRAAMNDAVADTKHVRAAVPGAQPGGQGVERTVNIARSISQRMIVE